MRRVSARLALLLSTLTGVCAAQSPPIGVSTPPAAEALQPRVVITVHHGVFNHESISYRAIAGEQFIRNADGQVGASVFSISYVKEGVKDPATRPVMFLFNGGPGASSVYVHLGGFGPRRVVVPGVSDLPGGAPYRLTDNPYSILDVTDLVFIDPVGTGYSRVVNGKLAEYESLIGDAHCTEQFIRQWLTAYGRWNSPKYLTGESYGTHRAAMIVRDFASPEESTPVTFNGVVMLGQALDFTQTDQIPGNDIPDVIYLPTYAALAWYHGKVDKRGRTFEQFIEQAREFANTHYLLALQRGSTVTSQQEARIAEKIAEYSGLPVSYIERHNLRITTHEFAEKLLQSEGRELSTIDGRYSSKTIERINAAPDEVIPPGINAAFNAAINAYLQTELNVHFAEQYKVSFAPTAWDFTLPGHSNFFQNYLNLAPYVSNVMREYPSMRMFVGSGYYDLEAAFGSAERMVSHNGFPSDQITVRVYQSGHMIYLSTAGSRALNDDVRTFVKGSEEAKEAAMQ